MQQSKTATLGENDDNEENNTLHVSNYHSGSFEMFKYNNYMYYSPATAPASHHNSQDCLQSEAEPVWKYGRRTL